MRIQEPPRDSRKLHPRGSRRLQEASGGSRSPGGALWRGPSWSQPPWRAGSKKLQEDPGGQEAIGSHRSLEEAPGVSWSPLEPQNLKLRT
jgi:hypothetical protein